MPCDFSLGVSLLILSGTLSKEKEQSTGRVFRQILTGWTSTTYTLPSAGLVAELHLALFCILGFI